MKVLIITGAGRGFCSGANLSVGGPTSSNNNKIATISSKTAHDLRSHFNPMIVEIQSSSKIVIAQVNGIAAGAGFSLAMACDFRICSKSSSFLAAFIRIGLVPDCGLSYFLPRIVGTTRAMEIMTLGEIIPSQKALDWGIANTVVQDDHLNETVSNLANKLLTGPSEAQGWTKKLVNSAGTADLLLALEQETKLQQVATGTAEFKERVKRFTKPKL